MCLGGHVSNRQGGCEGISNMVLFNTSSATLVSYKVLHIEEDHLYKFVGIG